MSTLPARVLVTDGLWRKSLSAVRSLGKAGFSVSVMGDSLFTTSFWSRFTRERILAPLAHNAPEQFGKALLKSLEKSPETVIFPMEDASLTWIAENFEKVRELNGIALIPPLHSLRIALDKSKTLDVAHELKIPYPTTIRSEGVEDFLQRIKTLQSGEFIVKPRSGSGAFGFRVFNQETSERSWKKHWERFGPLLIQERIPLESPCRGVGVLMDQRSNCVAHFAHERLKQYPISGGPSTDRKSIQSPELIQMSISLLKHLSWQGVAMVEWKYDPRDRKTKLMEINPRFWGSLELAVRSGVDFPTLYARLSLGEKIETPAQYKEGVRCRWMIPGEILRYAKQPKSEREPLREFLEGLPSLAEEWDPDDLDGFVSACVCTGAKAFNPQYWKYAGPR